VIVTSYAAIEAIPGLTLSNVLRPAVHALVRELARHLGAAVLVNALAPGRIDTERVRDLDRASAEARGIGPDQVRAEQARAIALGRYGLPEELARVAVFLLSRENTYVSGQCLLVDGGLVRSP
jgi:3-oxoacyl-[acyl-carrier protein] reductase